MLPEAPRKLYHNRKHYIVPRANRCEGEVKKISHSDISSNYKNQLSERCDVHSAVIIKFGIDGDHERVRCFKASRATSSGR